MKEDGSNRQLAFPEDMICRLQAIASLKVKAPIIFDSVEEQYAEYINYFSDGWVEVFVLNNNEDGVHYFYRS